VLIADPDPYVQGLGFALRAAIRENHGDVGLGGQDAELAYERFELAGDHWGMGMTAQAIGARGEAGAGEWLGRGERHMDLLGAVEDADSIRVLRDTQLAQAGDDAAAARLAGAIAAADLQSMDSAQAHLGLAQHSWLRGRYDAVLEHADRAMTIADGTAVPLPQMRVVLAVAAAVLHLRVAAARERPAGERPVQLLRGARDEALPSLDVPALGSWALGGAALAKHRGEAAVARELWALGLRCGANILPLFERGDAITGEDDGADAWRDRPVTEVTDRIRVVMDGLLAEPHTLRR
jgi:hypothetical protein